MHSHQRRKRCLCGYEARTATLEQPRVQAQQEPSVYGEEGEVETIQDESDEDDKAVMYQHPVQQPLQRLFWESEKTLMTRLLELRAL